MGKSIVWNYFKKVNKLTGVFVICQHCKKEFKSTGNTTNLSKHLQFNHPMLFSELRKAKEEVQLANLDNVDVIEPETVEDKSSESERYVPNTFKNFIRRNALFFKY